MTDRQEKLTFNYSCLFPQSLKLQKAEAAGAESGYNTVINI